MKIEKNKIERRSITLIFLSSIIFGILTVASYNISCADIADEIIKNNGEQKMKRKGVCDIPEDISEFKKYLLASVGDRITLSSIKKLQTEFEIIKDEMTYDISYSSTEKVRFIGLLKNCTAPDKVLIKWQIGAIMDAKGNSIFQQLYLVYTFKDIFEGKRRFSFGRFHGTNTDYTQLISKETVGLLNDVQISEYMKNLGAVLLKKGDGRLIADVYVYEIDFKEDIASRLAVWNFSKRIDVIYDLDRFVSEVHVSHN